MSTPGVCLRQECAIWPRPDRRDPAAEAAIRVSDDVFAADDHGVAQDAIGDKQRVLAFDDGVTQ